MSRINLLPWRQESRNRATKIYCVWLGLVILVSILLVAIGALIAEIALKKQQQRNLYLESNSAEMDRMLAEITEIKIKRQELSLRMKVVRSLQDGRTEIVSIFDQLVYAIPEDIYLTKLERSAATMMLYGVSESNHQLSVLMRNLNKSAQYDNASLFEMQQDNNASAFNLQVIVGAKISPKL